MFLKNNAGLYIMTVFYVIVNAMGRRGDMKKYCLLLMLCVIWLSADIFADVIYLRDGRIINGEVLKETKYSIRIDTEEGRQVFYHDEIDSVEYQDEAVTAPDAAQDVEPLDNQEVSAEKRELVLQLLKVNGAIDGIKKTIAATIANAPQDRRLEVKKYFDSDELAEVFIPIYAAHFSEEQLKELIIFYQSDTGKHQLQVGPMILEETMRASINYFQSIMAADFRNQ